MTRQVTDQLYIELDYYYPEDYYVYIAQAQSQQAVSSTITCDAGKITQAQAVMVVTTVITATISHIEGADLFAFSESLLAAQVDRIRDNNIETSGVFTVSAEVSKIRSLAADQFAISNIAVINERSRDFVLEAQAAFSLIVETGAIELANANLVSTTTLTSLESATKGFIAQLDLTSAAVIDIARTREFNSNQSVTTETTALGAGTRNAVATLDNTTELQCIISHIEGADLQAFGESQVTIDADIIAYGLVSLSAEFTTSADGQITADRSVAISSTSTQVATATKTIRSIVNFAITSTISTNVRILDDRTTFVANSGNAYTNIRIDNDVKQFGQGSLVVPFFQTDLFDSRRPYSSFDHWVTVSGTTYHIYPGSTYSSSDGINWTRQNNNLSIEDRSFRQVIHTGSQFVLHLAGSGNTDTIYTSSDALTWSSTTTSSFGTSTVLRTGGIAFLSGFYYVAGVQSTGAVRIWRTNSATFQSWSLVYNVAYSATVSIKGFFRYGNTLYLGFESGGAGGPYPGMLRSTNGTTWTDTSRGNGEYVEYFGRSSLIGVVLVTRNISNNQYQVFTYSGSWAQQNYQLNETITSIDYDGFWLVRTPFNIYSTPFSDVSNLTQIPNYQTFKDTVSSFTTHNNSLIFFKNDQALYRPSPSSSTLNANALTVPADKLRGSVEYTSLTNDFQLIKTIDFWMRAAAASNNADAQNILIYNSQNNREYIQIGLFNGRFRLYSQYFDNTSTLRSFEIYNTSNAQVGTSWNHFRIVFGTTTVRVWQNGTKLTISDSSIFSGFDIPNAKVVFFSNGFDDLWIDEFLITDDELTSVATTSFTAPNRQWSNTVNTDLLLHFNTDFIDDSRYAVVEQANLVSTSTVTAAITGTQNAVISMQVISTATIQAQRSSEIILSAFGDSQTIADGIRNRYADAALSATIELSALNLRIKATDASLALDFQQSVTANITASIEAAIAGITVSLTATARVRSGDIQANVESQMITTAEITAVSQADLASAVVIQVPGERIRYADSNQNAETAIVADLGLIKRFVSDLQSQTAQTTDAVKTVQAQIDIAGITISLTALGAIRQGLISMPVESTVTVDAEKIADGLANIQSTSQAVINGIIRVNFDADLVSTTQIQADNLRIRYSDAALAVESAQTADINYTAFGESQQAIITAISATATGTIDVSAAIQATSTATIFADRFRDNVVLVQSATAITANNTRTRDNDISNASEVVVTAESARTRPFDAGLVANSIDMFVAAKIGTALVDMPMFSSMAVTGNLIAYGLIPLESQTESQITAVKNSNVQSSMIAQSVILAEGTTNITGEADFITESVMVVDGTAIFAGSMSIAADTDLTAVAQARRGFAILEQSSGTMTVSADRIRDFSSNFASISIDLIIGDKVVSFNAALVATTALTAQGRDIDLAKYVYVIPNELRTWTISEENRTRVIKQETRVYKIRRY